MENENRISEIWKTIQSITEIQKSITEDHKKAQADIQAMREAQNEEHKKAQADIQAMREAQNEEHKKTQADTQAFREYIEKSHKKSQADTQAFREYMEKSHKESQADIQALREFQRETALQMKDTDRQMKETDRRLKKLDDLFNGQWGKLMEALVKGDLIKLLNSRGIQVNGVAREHERQWNGKHYEYDIIAVNGEEIVVVEVKTTLRLEGVNHFIDKLEVFKKVWPEYGDKRVYGGVAYLKANEGTDRNSESRGLFVIRATGSSASIINAEHFKPRAFVS